LGRECGSGGERGAAFRKQRSGAYPALKGSPHVSTVRTEKLVFSLNYERLGNRANVAGTGTSLCRLIGVAGWIADFAQMMEEVGMNNIGTAVKSGRFLRIVYGNKLAYQGILGPDNGD
jgi:hypothetical protein